MEVCIKETNVIEPAKETPKTHLWLSDLDLIVPAHHVPTIYFYKPNPDSNANFFDAHVLKDALAEAIVTFYPVAGTLGTDENGRTCIDCNANGVLFVEAETTCVIDDFGDFTPCPEMQRLLPTIDSSLDDPSKPLFAVQLTRFKCGSVSLGIMLHHMLCDGPSAIDFINSWSDIARGKSISIQPFFDRTLLRARVPPAPSFHHTEFDPHPTLEKPSDPEPTSTRVLKITPDQLYALKSKFSAYSTFEILAAHVWYCLCKARDLPPDQATRMNVPLDGRSRLNPPLPRGYFGNPQFTTAVLSTAGEILSTPLDQTMEKIRHSIRKRNGEYLRSEIDYLNQQPDLTALRRGARTSQCPNLDMVSWTKMPIYEADFGWGKPVHMGRGKIIREGVVGILPSPNNDCTLLSVFLQANHIESFQKFFYDFRNM